MKGSSEAGTKLCLAALTRVVNARVQRPEVFGSAQHVGGHGLVGHLCGRDELCARELAGSKSGRAALGSVGGPVKSRWEGNAPTDYSRGGARYRKLPEGTITPLRQAQSFISRPRPPTETR